MELDIEFKPKPKRTLQSLRAKIPPSIHSNNDRELPKYVVFAYIDKIESLLSISCTISLLIKSLIHKYYYNPIKSKQSANNYNEYDIANITFRCIPHKSIKSLPTYIDYQSIPITLNNDNEELECKQLNDYNDINQVESMAFIMNDNQTQSFINDQLEIAYNDNINDENSNVLDFDAFFYERKKKFNKMIKMTQNNNNRNKLNKNSNDYIVYITWNIWYNNKIALIQRIKGIGDIIECNKCDIICLQEVTPQSLEMIQQSKWYIVGGYQSIDISHFLEEQFGEKHRKYWNVIITKHEFIANKLYWKQFEQTSMIRHIILVPIKLKNCNKMIYVATTHLKSAIGKESKNKYSFQRKQELKCCMDLLNDNNKCNNNNIIFGGDFNWFESTKNKKYDGDINKCLNKYWIDGYKQLHPNNDGFTYDAMSNPMLTSNLKGRLDRILYKNNGNLNLKSIKIIGKEAIPDINYHKVIIRNGREIHKILSVLPSDHYGLCAHFVFDQS